MLVLHGTTTVHSLPATCDDTRRRLLSTRGNYNVNNNRDNSNDDDNDEWALMNYRCGHVPYDIYLGIQLHVFLVAFPRLSPLADEDGVGQAYDDDDDDDDGTEDKPHLSVAEWIQQARRPWHCPPIILEAHAPTEEEGGEPESEPETGQGSSGSTEGTIGVFQKHVWLPSADFWTL